MMRILSLATLFALCATGFAADAKPGGTPTFAEPPPAIESTTTNATAETYQTDDKHKLVPGDAVSFRNISIRRLPD